MNPHVSATNIEWVSWPRVCRGELAIVGIVLVVGVSMRLLLWPHAAVEHFDEGVYASNLLFDESTNYRYPMQHFYAPPLLPALIQGTMVLSGEITSQAAVFPSLLAGVMTLLAVWKLARQWLGPSAAVAATSLAAFSDVHLLFSVAALTDALLLFGLVGALGLYVRACHTGRLRGYILAGMVTGLAWWTKYNGWLPLAIALCGTATWWLANRRTVRLAPLAGGWILTAVIALAVWSPWLISLQSYGGYSAIAANHRQYVVGLAGWFESLMRQIANMQFVDGWRGTLGWGIALMAAYGVTHAHDKAAGHASARLPVPCLVAGPCLAMAAAHWCGASLLCVILAVAYPALAWNRESRRAGRLASPAFWTLAVWVSAMLLLTPLYTPYLRLILPWLGGSWLACGGVIGTVLGWQQARDRDHDARFSKRTWAACVATAAGSLVAILLAPRSDVTSASLNSRDSWRKITPEIRHAADQNVGDSSGRERRRVFYIYGEPAILFQLLAAGETLVSPVNDLSLEPVAAREGSIPTFLVTGLHARRDRRFGQLMQDNRSRFQLVQSIDYLPGTLVLLDHFDPRGMDIRSRTEQVRVYRVRNQELRRHDDLESR